jgi:hypothetical protein
MRRVIVLNDHDVEVAIVAARMAPIERTPADERREEHGDDAGEIPMSDAPTHPF